MSAFLLPLWFACPQAEKFQRLKCQAALTGQRLHRRFRHPFFFSLKKIVSETPSIAVEKGIPNPTGRYSQLIFIRYTDYRNSMRALE
jgi:hypothetical protein